MREKILYKATELFLNLGFKSITMDDLAREMCISKKTIYSHFCNKTKLVEECTMNLFHTISDGIDKIIAQQKNPIEELYEIKKFLMFHLKDQKSSPQYQLQKYYPKLHDTLIRKQFEVMLGSVINNINQGIEMGIYRENLDVEFIARFYFAGSNSIKDNELFPSDKFPMSKIKDDFLEYHIRGIATPKGRKILNSIINSNQE